MAKTCMECLMDHNWIGTEGILRDLFIFFVEETLSSL